MHPKLIKLGIYETLLEKRVLYFDDEVAGRWAEVLGPAIVLLNEKSSTQPITLHIDSAGGAFSAGLDFYDAIRCSEAPVHGIVRRKALSMAVVALQACKKRTMMAHSRLAIHGISKNGPLTETNLRDPVWIERTLADFREKNNAIAEIYIKRTGQPEEAVRGWLSKDTEFTAHEALSVGLVDEII